MALPYDALTAALDSWLGQHIPNLERRARVRRAVDCLDDLRTAPLSHIEFATDLSSWPAIPRLRFLCALRELRGEHVTRARRDARVGRWVEVYYADMLAQQRSFVRSMRNPLPESLMLLKSMRTYGTRALRLTTDPPPGWTEVMLLTEHQEPVGRRSFQR